jgi:hypothetical protein
MGRGNWSEILDVLVSYTTNILLLETRYHFAGACRSNVTLVQRCRTSTDPPENSGGFEIPELLREINCFKDLSFTERRTMKNRLYGFALQGEFKDAKSDGLALST